MKIAVVGTGGVGGYFGALFALLFHLAFLKGSTSIDADVSLLLFVIAICALVAAGPRAFTSLLLRFAPPYLWSNLAWSVLLLSMAAAMAIAMLAIAIRLPNAGVRSVHRPFVYLGTISYGIYLWHIPVLNVLSIGRVPLPGPLIWSNFRN